MRSCLVGPAGARGGGPAKIGGMANGMVGLKGKEEREREMAVVECERRRAL